MGRCRRRPVPRGRRSVECRVAEASYRSTTNSRDDSPQRADSARSLRNPCAPDRCRRNESVRSSAVENVLSYNFDEIEYTVRQEIHTTHARLNAALDDLKAQIAPLQQVWT